MDEKPHYIHIIAEKLIKKTIFPFHGKIVSQDISLFRYSLFIW